MISLKNVSFSYDKGFGLTNINLDLNDGEFAFLIGPTGSGKSTILKLVYMDLMPDSGTVEVLGIKSPKIKKGKIPYLRRRIGMVFQDYQLLEDRNLFENVALALHILGVDQDEIMDRVSDALEDVGLTGLENHFPSELSGGEQQRACIARAMIKEPELILADEPTGNVDPVAAYELVKLLEELNQEGTAVLMASHNYGLIKGRGHRIIEVQEGQLRRS